MVEPKSDQNELIIERTFAAPRTQLWQAWSDADQLKRWWSPAGFTTPTYEVDFRVGGKYLYCMADPSGQKVWGTGVYREIVPQERIVCTDSFADEDGHVVPASHYGMDVAFPQEMEIQVTFDDLPGGQTKLMLKHIGPPTDQMRQEMADGWTQLFDKLEQLLAATPN